MFRTLSVIVILHLALAVEAQSPVFLNEVLANNTTLTDLSGNTPDWIELYNSSTNDINLAGMSLSNDPTNPRRWIFPEGITLRGRDYLVVYCDGNLPATTWNTGFGLSANGDAIYLFDQATNRTDSIAFGLQVADFSIGRLQTAGGAWYLMRPTIGAANVQAALGTIWTLRLNEWMADPVSGGDWFELYNPDPNPVALGGLFLSNSIKKDPYKSPMPALTFIGSGVQGYQKFVADNDPASGANHVSFKLSKDGDSLGLFPSVGLAIDALSFGPQATGISEGRLPDGSATWVRFADISSPGKSNFLPLTNVVINEILTHTDPPEEDAVELYNPSTANITIGGWFLSDSPSNFKKFKIPTGTILPALGYVVIYEHQLTNSPAPFTFNSSAGDAIYLSAADTLGNLTGYRAEVHYGAAANGVSFGRYTNSIGGVQYPAQNKVTLGAANAEPLIGPIVINELMSYPPLQGTNDNTVDEYVELINLATNITPLYNPLEPTNTWRISGGIDYVFPPGVSLPPGGCLLVASFSPLSPTDAALLAEFRARYAISTNVQIYGPYNRKLGNLDDTVILEKPDPIQGAGHVNQGFVPYVVVDQVTYSSDPPWPVGGNGTGQALQRKDPFSYGDDPVNWVMAPPTAGRINSTVSDHDKDGLPDAWEWANGFNPNDPADALLDSDRDGLNNLQEYLGGTDPRNPQSGLKIRLTGTSGNSYLLRFTAVAGLSYTVQYRDSLLTGNWLKLQDWNVSTNTTEAEISDVIPNTGNARFYRLVTPKTP